MQRTAANARRAVAELEDEPTFWGARQWRECALDVCRIAINDGVPESIANAEYGRFAATIERNIKAATRIVNRWAVGLAPAAPMALSPTVERSFWRMVDALVEST